MSTVELSTLGDTIKQAYEGEPDTNALTDSRLSQLNQNTTDIATKEPDLGDPARNGQVLTSLSDGTRSWQDFPSGEFNYCSNPNDSDNWTGATTTTDSGILPCFPAVRKGILIASSATYSIQIGEADLGKLLKIEFWYRAQSATTLRVNWDGSQLGEDLSLEYDDAGTAYLTMVVDDTTAKTLEIIGNCSLCNVTVGPGKTTQGAIVSKWEAIESADQTWENGSSIEMFKRRVGSSLCLNFFNSGGAQAYTSGEVSFILPDNLSIDTNFDDRSGTAFGPIYISRTDISLVGYGSYGASNKINFIFCQDDTDIQVLGSDLQFTGYLRGTINIPIQEWAESGTVELMDASYVNQNYSIRNNGQVSAITLPADTQVTIKYVNTDSDDNYDSTSGIWTCPHDGIFEINAAYGLNEVDYTADLMQLKLMKNGGEIFRDQGSFDSDRYPNRSVNVKEKLVKGDQISVDFISDTAGLTTTATTQSWLHITQVPDYTSGQPVGLAVAKNNNYGLIQGDSWIATEADLTINAGTGTVNIELQKNGNVVTGKIKYSLEKDGASGQLTIDAIPEQFRPNENTYLNAIHYYGTSYQLTQIGILDYGRISVWAIYNSQNWTAGAQATSVSSSPNFFAFSYSI